MKWLNILICLYMIILAIMPCQDRDDAGVIVNTVSVQQSHENDEKAGKEICTPFCTCSCCSTVRTLTPIVTIASTIESPVKKNYRQSLVPALSDQALSIFQPPQLG